MVCLRGRLGDFFSFEVAQFLARQFADRCSGEFVAEFQRRGQFVTSKAVLQKRDELFQRERLGARLERDEGLGGLSAVFVRNAEHDAFAHGRVFVDRLFDHLRIDIEAAGNDHVLLAVDDVEVPVWRHVSDIAGEEEAIGERHRVFFRLVPVTRGHVLATYPQFTDFADRQDPVRVVEVNDLQLDAGQRHADRSGLGFAERQQVGACRRGFGHAPAAGEPLAGQALEPLAHFHRQGRAT
jgi:hypothetical protein